MNSVYTNDWAGDDLLVCLGLGELLVGAWRRLKPWGQRAQWDQVRIAGCTLLIGNRNMMKICTRVELNSLDFCIVHMRGTDQFFDIVMSFLCFFCRGANCFMDHLFLKPSSPRRSCSHWSFRFTFPSLDSRNFPRPCWTLQLKDHVMPILGSHMRIFPEVNSSPTERWKFQTLRVFMPLSCGHSNLYAIW